MCVLENAVKANTIQMSKELGSIHVKVRLWVGSNMCLLENAVKANTIQLSKELGSIHGVDKFVCV